MIHKYRIWDKKNKKMYDQITLINYSDNYVLVRGDIAIDLKDVDFFCGTGAADSEGVEIYEGDIVRYSDNKLFNRESTEGIFEVKWCNECLKYVAVHKYSAHPLAAYINDYIELKVIGNIYESPSYEKPIKERAKA